MPALTERPFVNDSCHHCSPVPPENVKNLASRHSQRLQKRANLNPSSSSQPAPIPEPETPIAQEETSPEPPSPLGMPGSGPDWGSDPVRTGPDPGSGQVLGPVRPFALGSGLGFGMGWVSCEPSPNRTGP